ncbi:S-layer homology domain-containing protein [Candidatus Peregrinibacteria bacterium]|nr:S-layer homology domain-containing protein [Candidatus Peregrinibacteria bacterium]
MHKSHGFHLKVLGLWTLTLTIVIGLASRYGQIDTQTIQLNTLATASASAFTDVTANHKYFKSINFLKEQEVVKGYEDGTFKPDKSLTRAEFMKIILLGNRVEIKKADKPPFPDVPLGEWYTDYIATGKGYDFIKGYQDGLFRPEQELSKVEALKILGELVSWDMGNIDPSTTTTKFSDVDLSQWYGKYTIYAEAKNILDDALPRLNPNSPISRGQMSEYIFRDYAVRELDIPAYDSSYDQQILSTSTISDTACIKQKNATSKVIGDIIDKSGERDKIVMYKYKETLQPGDKFSYPIESPEDTDMIEEVTLNEDSSYWFFWLDYAPETFFEHDTQLITVNTESCAINEYDSTGWPTLNDEPLWDTDVKRAASPDDVGYRGSLAPTYDPPGDPATVQFNDCTADPARRRKALILYAGHDYGIKLDASHMKDFLCGMDYQTTTMTAETGADALHQLEAQLDAVAAASKEPNGSLNGFVFYTVSHGKQGTGNLVFPQQHSLGITFIAQRFRDHAFNNDGIASEAFTIIQDTCYSGKAIPIFKNHARNKNVVGWIGTSTGGGDKTYLMANWTSTYKEAIRTCVPSFTGYTDMQSCLVAKTNEFKVRQGQEQTPQMSKLTTQTPNAVPFIP